MGSITKQAVFDSMTRKGEPFELPNGNTVYIVAVAESKRVQRLGQMVDKNGKVRRDRMMFDRIWSIIDQVADQDGVLIFTDGDFADLQAQPSSEIDKLVNAIEAYNMRGPAKNDQSESTPTSDS